MRANSHAQVLRYEPPHEEARPYPTPESDDAAVQFVRSLHAADVPETFIEAAALAVLDDVEAWWKTVRGDRPGEG